MNKDLNKPNGVKWECSDQADQEAIRLDENGKLNKATVLNRLRESFNFPDYFGENWDAAYDLLLDSLDIQAGSAIWRFTVVGVSDVNEDDFAVWLHMMADVCHYAESRGLQLQVVVQSDSRRI